METLKTKIRTVTEHDRRKLPTFSYSKIEVFRNCPMQYKIKYIDKKYSFETTLALELGNICHYVLEQKGKMITSSDNVDYDMLADILYYGTEQTDEKTKESLAGVNVLKRKYFEQWYENDASSGMNYQDKIKLFVDTVLKEEMNNDDWTPLCFEYPFEFVWDNKYILHGFIDRIDVRNNADGTCEYRVIDYKTSKKVFDEKKLPTALQFGIYALAVLNDFNTLPVSYEYHFILLNKIQTAMTKGYEKRLLKTLDNVFDSISKCTEKELFVPSPTPLCHWCSYCATNPDAEEYKNECEYYSLWTKTNKTFEVNKKWNAIENTVNESKNNVANNTRKLIF